MSDVVYHLTQNKNAVFLSYQGRQVGEVVVRIGLVWISEKCSDDFNFSL